MDRRLQAIVDAATPERLTELELRDALLAGLRIDAGGVDVTQWGPNPRELTPGEEAWREAAEAQADEMLALAWEGKPPPDVREALVRQIIADMMGDGPGI